MTSGSTATPGTGRVAVVGAGVAGLAAATALAARGVQVELFESAPAAGGRARSFEYDSMGGAVDNGQHLLMACYRECFEFFARIGVPEEAYLIQDALEATMLERGGKAVRVSSAGRWPASVGLALGLLRMRRVGLPSRLRALGFGAALRAGLGRPHKGERVTPWLERVGQSSRMRQVFWDPLCWATLNEKPEHADAGLLMAVLRRAFLDADADARLVVPRVGLSELYVEPSLRYLRARGATIHLSTPVRHFLHDAGTQRATGLALRDGSEREFDAIIAALPPTRVHALMPEALRTQESTALLEHLGSSPIVNFWARVDRIPFSGDFVGLVDCPVHWIFARERIEGRTPPQRESGQGTGRAHAGELLTATISGAHDLVERDREQLQSVFEAVLREWFVGPPVRVLEFRAIKEKSATIAQTPATQARRLGTRSELRGLFHAGDWVDTGLPATIESAAQAGHAAARAALELPGFE